MRIKNHISDFFQALYIVISSRSMATNVSAKCYLCDERELPKRETKEAKKRFELLAVSTMFED